MLTAYCHAHARMHGVLLRLHLPTADGRVFAPQMLALSAAGYACFAAMRGWLFGVLNNRFVCNLRSRLFGVLMREETSFHGEPATGFRVYCLLHGLGILSPKPWT